MMPPPAECGGGAARRRHAEKQLDVNATTLPMRADLRENAGLL